MKFMLSRDRTIASTCGLAIEFKKGELHLVPPAMYAEVIAAGGVPESELADDELPQKAATPEALEDRKAKIFAAFDVIAKRNAREDFTAGGMPHNAVLARETGWAVAAKERDATWVEYLAKAND